MAKRAPKPKLGRPPLGDKARSSTYLLKLTPDERATWQALADKQGITLAQLVREKVARALRSRRCRDLVSEFAQPLRERPHRLAGCRASAVAHWIAERS